MLNEIPASLVESPAVTLAMEAFVTEAIAEASDMLINGDTQTKIALVKMVLGESFKARRDSSGVEAEQIHEQTRALFEGLLEGVVGDDADEPEDGDGAQGGADGGGRGA